MGEVTSARPGGPRLTRARAVLGLLALGVLVLVSSALVWTRAVVAGPFAGAVEVTATGAGASPLVPALGLVVLAGAGAASTTRRVGTPVAAGGVAVAGVGVAVAAAGVLRDPLGATAAEVGDVLGVTGASVTAADATATGTGWPVVAVVLGVAVAVLGAAAALASRGWASGRRFEAPAAAAGDDHGGLRARGEDPAARATARGSAGTVGDAPAGGVPGPPDPAAERLRRRGEAFDAWDSLSRGEDPTGDRRV
ncbi:Trp biosynthesis-associated membrane protein [Pseudokineococcus sp. 1T1Z-3]|uniref:Trp biosynthesis-associated membrane protein n=1 Tax=Pseudokineococcus sp. 1T1Z-3 TaxID=3132745 RepID=UPI0030954F34